MFSLATADYMPVQLILCTSLSSYQIAVLSDMAIAYIFWEEFGIMATDPGYGYFRPTINLFDPGWRLTPDGHDTGTHAAAVMDRQACSAYRCLPLPNVNSMQSADAWGYRPDWQASHCYTF